MSININMHTSEHSQHILIALCGISPAVITETIWAMAMESIENPDQADLPHRIVVLTTNLGKQTIINQLLTPHAPDKTSIWQQLRDNLEQRGFNLKNRLEFGDTSSHLRVFYKPCHISGLATPLDDIHSAEDQNHAADFTLDTLRNYTEQPNTKITASLAGGRKTMSALLYGSMSLIGRTQDQLTHVLINPPYDSPTLIPKFYFPAQCQQELLSSDKNIHLASDAKINLADVPFVPMRYLFEKHLGHTPVGFSQLVANYTGNSLTVKYQPILSLDSTTASVHIDHQPLPLSLKEFGLIHFLASRTLNQSAPYPDYKSGHDDYCAHITQLRKSAPLGNQHHPLHQLPTGDSDDIRKIISKIKSKIQDLIPTPASLITALPQKGRLSLDYPSDKLQITP
jgi:CRISPR-associated protein (TIGR02584 family)